MIIPIKFLKKISNGRRRRKIKGFYYTLEEHKIKEYMKLTTEEKLQWLEEIFLFTKMVLTQKQKEMRNKLRLADIQT